MDLPLVTVLTLSYNSPDLPATIDSVLSQTYGAIEYIIVDDGSRVFSRVDIERYIMANRRSNLKRFAVLQNEVNIGTVKASNLGLKESRGIYIFNLAGDDQFADPEVLTDWVAAFERTGALIMTARRDNYDAQMGARLSAAPTEEQIRLLQNLPPQALFEQIAGVNFIFGCCTARTRSCIERYGLYDEHYRLIDDHAMNLRLLRQGVPFHFFDRVVVKYRGAGVSSAGRYDTAYERDADLIFEREVAPYTVHPFRARAQYRRWKRGQSLERDFQWRLSNAKTPQQRLMARAWYHAHHPFTALFRLLRDPGQVVRVLFHRK